MKEKKWVDANHMLMESGVKIFDKQCDLVGTGCIFSDVQTSYYIRAENADADLKVFRRAPCHIHRIARTYANEYSKIILYQFHHHDNKGNKIIDCYVISDGNYQFLTASVINRRSGHKIMAAVLPYIVEVIEQ